MSIQISVTIWTVLCFLALMLVLDRLLFRPMLTFMDKRREKIEDARRSRETAVRDRAEEIRRREEDRAAAEKKAMAEAAAALEELRAENARRLAEKKADNERRLAEERETLAEESSRILDAARPTDEMIRGFAERVLAWQDTPDPIITDE